MLRRDGVVEVADGRSALGLSVKVLGRLDDAGGGLRWWIAPLAISALFISAFWAVLIFRPWPSTSVLAVDDTLDIAGTLVAFAFAVGFFWRRPRMRRRTSGNTLRWASVLIGCAILSYGLGSLAWDCLQLALNEQPFPSIADVFYLLFYPFLLGGVLLLTAGVLSTVARTRIMLDGLMIMVAVGIVSWYFVLGPTIQVSGESTLAKVVGAAYPVADLALILCLVLLWSRAQNPALYVSILFVTLGLSVTVFADSVFAYQGLHGGAPSPSLLDPAWTAGVMLLGIAAGTARHARAAESHSEATSAESSASSPPPLGYVLAPYALLPVVACLVLYLVHASRHGVTAQGVYLGCVVLVAMVVVRQIVALKENNNLYRQVAAANRALGATNDALENANGRLQLQATTDPITGGLNHRAIQHVLKEEVGRQRRYGRPCAVLFLDVDFFKAINDTHGHAVGDQILKQFDTLVSSTIRAADSVGRWGGEEFIAVLPETDVDAAIAVAERIRESVASAEFSSAGLRMTCSIGVAGCPEDGRSIDDLVTAADHAMYAGKMLGRNQVCAASGPPLDGALSMTGTAGRA